MPITLINPFTDTFPTVNASNISDATGTSHTIVLPSGPIAGELLLVFFCHHRGTHENASTPSGWTEEYYQGGFSSASLKVISKIAAGSDPNPAITTDTAEDSAHISLRIGNWGGDQVNDFEIQTTKPTGSSDTPNPPSLSATGGADNYLWIGAGWNEDVTTVTGYPSNCPDNQLSQAAGTVTVYLATAELNATTFDPQAFSLSASANWFGSTSVIHP